METKVNKTVGACAAVLVLCGWSIAQTADGGIRGQGTVNQMSNDPQQNQRLTGTMGSTTGGSYEGGVSDHSQEVAGKVSQGQSSATNRADGSAGQPDKVPPPGTGMETKGEPITSSPGAVAATGPKERVEQQRNEKSAIDLPEPEGAKPKQAAKDNKKDKKKSE